MTAKAGEVMAGKARCVLPLLLCCWERDQRTWLVMCHDDTVGDVLPQLLEVLYVLMIKVDLKKIQEENGSQMELYIL